MTVELPENAARPPVGTTLMLVAGRTLMTLGAVTLAFAGFQLWGTGLAESRAQAELNARFEEQLALAAVIGPAETPDPVDLPTSDGQPTEPGHEATEGRTKPVMVVDVGEPERAEDDRSAGSRKTEPMPGFGDPIGVLDIPAIGVNKTVAHGTGREVLRSGPGHYPSTPLPWQPGNVAIAGHRTTHGAPFLDIDRLEPGDTISVETVRGTYVYSVEGQLDDAGRATGHRIVTPEAVDVITDQGDNRLTLTACHPKYSARQRIIVTAVRISGPEPEPEPKPETAVIDLAAPTPVAPAATPAPAGPTPTGPAPDVPPPPPANPGLPTGPTKGVISPDRATMNTALGAPAGETLGWQIDYAAPTAWWAAVTAAMAMTAWVIGRLWRRFPSYAMAVPPMTLSLYYCFVNLERFIPAV